MSTATLEQVDVVITDWEFPSGPTEVGLRPRCESPPFIYGGDAEAHWVGQPCHVLGDTRSDERTIILACGCTATVPWWTLQLAEHAREA